MLLSKLQGGWKSPFLAYKWPENQIFMLSIVLHGIVWYCMELLCILWYRIVFMSFHCIKWYCIISYACGLYLARHLSTLYIGDISDKYEVWSRDTGTVKIWKSQVTNWPTDRKWGLLISSWNVATRLPRRQHVCLVCLVFGLLLDGYVGDDRTSSLEDPLIDLILISHNVEVEADVLQPCILYALSQDCIHLKCSLV